MAMEQVRRDEDELPLLEEELSSNSVRWPRFPKSILAATLLVAAVCVRGGLPRTASRAKEMAQKWEGWGSYEGENADSVDPYAGEDSNERFTDAGSSQGQDGYEERYQDGWGGSQQDGWGGASSFDQYDGQNDQQERAGYGDADSGYGQGAASETPSLDPSAQEAIAAGLAAAQRVHRKGAAAADQAAAAGTAAAKQAATFGFSEKESGKLAAMAAEKAGLAAGMPKAAAETAGMLASKALTEDPTPPPEPIPARIQCRDAVNGYESECLKDTLWIKNNGILSKPEWYPGLTPQSSLGEFQTAAVKSGKSSCILHGCDSGKMECLPNDCGCMDEAVQYYQSWVAKYPGGSCEEPQVNVDGHCLCPPNMVPDPVERCKVAREPVSMTFYMYRAQSDYCYNMENVNLGDLAGVMWYLHKEVVASVPRKYNVTRILRFLVTVKNPQKTFQHEHFIFGGIPHGKQFGPFGAFDNAQCTATHCMSEMREFGNAVGCQAVETGYYNYQRQAPVKYCEPSDSPECVSGTWYSLPGPCPSKPLFKKTDQCKQEFPGAQCANPDGSEHCTFNTRYAGQVSLDELIGIDNYEEWWKDESGPTGNIEYEVNADNGNGTTWWDARLSERQCSDRMQQVQDLFAKRYPALPRDLPDPPCL